MTTAEQRNHEREAEIRKDHADERTVGDHRAWREERAFLLSRLDEARRATDAGQPAVTALREALETELPQIERCLQPIGSFDCIERAFEHLERLRAALDAAAPPAPMTLEQAVGVLNERRHGAYDGWFAKNGQVHAVEAPLWFSEWEAIALAEKYLRDGTGEAQEVGDGE